MFRRIAVLIVGALLLTACAPVDNSPDAGSSASSTPTNSAATPTSEPAPARTLTIGVDGLTVTAGDDTETLTFDSPDALLALMEEITAAPRSAEDFEDPWGNGDVWGTRYTWYDITVSVLKDGPATVTVRAPALGGVPVQTASGIAVGASRNDVLSAGGWDEWDADGDGTADNLGIDERDVDGTQSLSRPGSIGREYVIVALEGDVVSELQRPGNDFSDI